MKCVNCGQPIEEGRKQGQPPRLAKYCLKCRAERRRRARVKYTWLPEHDGWEEKKTSWGGSTVDHEKLAEARIDAMTTAELNRFLVTCSLVPDLYCPGYGSVENLSKEANLTRAATRYKVDASKITARVTAELSAKGRPA